MNVRLCRWWSETGTRALALVYALLWGICWIPLMLIWRWKHGEEGIPDA